MSTPPCTLKDIAEAGGVSIATVSYALRNHPRIPLATRMRIQALARELGYQRNPGISAVMSFIGRGRPVRFEEKLALIWPQGSRADQKQVAFFRHVHAGVTKRAADLGYGLEQFWMEEDRLSGARLSTILTTRGIRGLVFAPAVSSQSLQPGLDWSQFSTVIMGYARWTPDMHRAMHNHYFAVRHCLEHVVNQGSRAPAIVLSAAVNERTDFAQEAAFLTHHPEPDRARRMIFFHDGSNLDALPDWLRRQRPDAVIFGLNTFYHHCLRQAPRCLTGRNLVTLEWEEEERRLPGIHQRHDLVGMAAVEMLATQLQLNQSGPPERPRTLSFNSDWREAVPAHQSA